MSFRRTSANKSLKRFRPLVELLEDRVVLANDFYQVPGVVGETVRLQFKVNGKATGANNELALYLVDDLQGRIDGLLPSQVGYATAAASRAQVLFQSTANVGSSREWNAEGGQIYGYLLVKRGSLEQWATSNPDNLPKQSPLLLFSVDAANPQRRDAVLTNRMSGDAVQVRWEDATVSSVKRLFNDNSFAIKPVRGSVLTMPGGIGQTVATTYTIAARNAGLKNEMGFFLADDETGAINGVLPGDPAYAYQAINSPSRQVLFSNKQPVGATKRVTLPSGSHVVFYIVQNNTTAEYLRRNPNNLARQNPQVFFSIAGANPDHFGHQYWHGFNRFGFEDIFNGGDKDFDDIVVGFRMEAPQGSTNPDIDAPIIAARLRTDTAPGGTTNNDTISSLVDIQGSVTDQSRVTLFLASLDQTTTFTNALARLQSDGTFLLDRAFLNQLAGGNVSEGAHTLYLRARDQFGNASTMYQVPFVLKSDASLTVNLAAGSDTAPVGDLKTSLSIVTLEGQADPSALIELVGTSQTTTADAQGAYSLTDLNLTPGNNLFTVKTTDVAGNTRTVPITIIYEPVTGSVCFDDLLTGWIVEEFGGTTAGKGRVTASNGSATIREGDSFLVTLSHDFVVPLQDSATLTVEYSLPQFDATATAQLRDAFEIAFVDSRGQSLVLPIAQERDAFLNLTEGLNPAIAPGVTTATGEVTVNLAGLVPGSTGRLVLRLVNNDGDTQSNVTISCVKVNTVIGLSPTSATIQEEVRQTNAQTIDFTKLVNVSTSIVPEYGRTSFQQQGLQLYSSLSLRHAGSTPLRGPMLVVLDRVSDASIIPQDADGYLPDGRAYFNISSTLTDNRLNPGATTGPRTIHFHNPLRKPFSYSVQVYSLANEVPVFETQPSTLVPPGRTWSYAAQARDANGDTVSYRLLSFPGGMTVDSVTGNVTWPIPANFTGNVSVILQASDEWGGASEQAFTLSVGTVPNRPPVITSVPVVDAYVDEPYSYPVKAFDADFDVLNFTLVQGVGNASIDSATGLLSFMPTPETLGEHTIIVRVSDGQGGTVDQAYTLNIRNNRTNHAPLFVTDPVLRIVAGQLYQYDANAIDADNDTITYRLTSNIVGMSVDSSTGLFQWNTDSYSPGNYPVTIEADDGRGGVTGQHFTLAIVAGPAAIIRGNVFNDIGGDGPNSSGTVTHQLSVNSHDAIFLAGRSDVNIPPIGTNDPNFPLLRTGGSGANFSVENKPQQVSVNPGQVLTFKASGIVNGVDALNFNVEPDGDRGGFSTTINSTPAIGGISGYRGYIGALVGVFLGDENPAGGTAPATLNFDDNAGGNSKFKTLAPALGQVFYIGDGYTNKQTSLGLPSSGVPQRFTAPTGATRLFIGLPDGGPRFASSKTPGNYDDNIGSFDVTVNIHPASTIFYDDTEFDNANWTSAVTLYEDGNPSLDGGDIGFFQNTGGGNPDAMREGFHYLRVGDVLVSGNLNLNAVYNPSTQGAIQSLNVSIDFKQISVFFQGPDSTGAILYLEQDGVRYYGVKAYLGFGAGQGGVDVWLNKTGTLTANDFDTNPLAAVDPPSATGIKPNFTSTGGPITFGFSMFNNATGNPGKAVRTRTATDNWFLQINRAQSDGPVPNFRVYLDENDNKRFDASEPSAISDVTGRYEIADVVPGDHKVRIAEQLGWRQTYPTGSGTYNLQLNPGQISSGIDFGVQVDPIVQNSPTIVSDPVTGGTIGQTYRYDVRGLGEGALFYDLPQRPDGMVIDRLTGSIAWVPEAGQLGPQQVVVRLRDGAGKVALQSFTILVASPNTAPVFISEPVLLAAVNRPYRYLVEAIDAENDALTYSLETPPAGMSIDSTTGMLDWTPAAAQLGAVPVQIRVRDAQGAETIQLFTITVSGSLPNTNPIILSMPPTRVRVNSPYRYQVLATDAEADRLSYQLVTMPSGMVIDPDTGLLTYTPSTVGEREVVLRVSDGQGGTATQSFTITVLGMEGNTLPVFLAASPGDASAGRLFRFTPTVSDADGDQLFWSLQDAPDGMSIDATTGLIRWIPRFDQVGVANFTVQVQDGLLGTANRQFTLNVRGANTPPLVISSPLTLAIVGQQYRYPLLAVDAEQNELNYTLLQGPAGMGIDAATGVLTWTPEASQAGTQTVSVEVSDGQGGQTRQNFAVSVSATPITLPPLISSRPPLLGSVNAQYQYQLNASDPQGLALTYSLQSGPTGMNLNASSGLLTWTPNTGQVGVHVVIVEVQNTAGLKAQQVYTITVGVNQVPVITSQPITQVSFGQPYRYDLIANDPNGDPLSYLLLEGPGGMIVSSTGSITWDTPALGTPAVHVRVSDGRGGTTEQQFTLSVTADTQAPQVTITFSQNPLPYGGGVVIRVAATDNVAVTDLFLTVEGQSIPLDADGTAFYTPVAINNFDVVASARDAVGNVGTTTSILQVVYEQDPTNSGINVGISSPVADAIITDQVNVTGTISGTNIGTWRVMIAPVGSNTFQTIATGSGQVFNSTLASFDPTLLANDQYRIRVVAQKTTGELGFREIIVNVEGELKLGRFALSFTDMSLPLAGIPISVFRSYDTLDATRSGDFGYGWRLGFADARIRETVPSNIAQGFFGPIDAPFKTGTRVFLTTPSGQRVGFTFDPVPITIPFFGTTYWKPRFVADPGVQEKLDTLTEPGNYYGDLYIKRDDGTFIRPFDILGGSYNPNDYNLTLTDGTIYRYNQDEGLRQIVDPSGNTVNFRADGIFSADGSAIRFERDAAGRITRIVDPAGKAVKYNYDTAGNLIRIDNQENISSTMTYRSTPAHYLETVLDPRGNQAMRTEYDAQGRITAYIDADGKRTTSTYDQNANSETVTDPLGNPTTLTYSNTGKLLSVRDSLNNIYRYEYDSRGNQTKAIDPTGSAVTREFDAENRITSMLDPLGKSYSVTYTSTGSINTVADAQGRVSTLLYDDQHRMVGQVNALGDISRMERDSMGRVVRYTDALGRVTTYEYQGAFTRPSVTTYADGARRYYQYNAQGLIISARDELGFITTYEYDSIGRATRVNFADGSSIRYTYNLDRLESKIDQLGNITRYEVDNANRLRKVIDPMGNITEVVYDANGQIIRQTDAENRSVNFTYRADGRLLSKTDPAGLVTSYEYDGAGNVTAETTMNETTRYTYDALGRLTSIKNALNNTTRYEYDSAGNLTRIIDPLNHELRYEYDALNRVTAKINHLNEAAHFSYDLVGNLTQVTDAIGRVVSNTFDSRNRLQRSDQPGGVHIQYTYDLAGNTTGITDIQNRTTLYSYDSMGRLFKMTDPTGQTQQAEFDLAGNVTALIDPLGQRTTMQYNPSGMLTRMTDTAGNSNTFEYNRVGQRTAIVDAAHQRSVFTYDAAGRMIRRTNPGGLFDQYEYDEMGMLMRTVDASGKVMEYEYDAVDNIISQTARDGIQTDVRSFTYDAAGRLQQATNRAGRYEFTYDAADRLVSQQFIDVSQAPSSTLFFTYDAAGRLIQTRDNFNARVDSTFDDRDRMISRTWQGDQLTSVRLYTTFNSDDQPDIVTRYADLTGTQKVGTSQYSYDTLGRITGITHRDASNSTLAQYSYQYDALSRVSQATENGVTLNYSYDALGQLLSTQRSAGSQENYSYDVMGNRQGGGRTYNALNQLISDDGFDYAYDADGRMQTRTERSTGTVTALKYNARNQVESIFKTDADGNIINQSYLTYDVFGQKVAYEIDGNVTSTSYAGGNPWADYSVNTPVTRYLYGGLDELLARDTSTTATEWYLTDRLGSVRDLTNSTGQVINHREYDSFGKILNETNPSAGDLFGFTGREYLSEFDLYDLRNRLYDANQGRFVSEDPLGFSGGDTNLYRFVNNDPVNHTDPLGLFSIGEYAGSLLSSNAIVNALFTHGGDGYFSISISAGAGGVKVGAGGDYSFSGSLGPQFKQFDTKLDWGFRNGAPFGSVSGGQHGINMGARFDGNSGGTYTSVDPQAMFKSFADYTAFNAANTLRKNNNTYDQPLLDFMNDKAKTGLGAAIKGMYPKPTTMGYHSPDAQKPPPPDEADFAIQVVSTARAPNFLMRFNAAAFGLPAIELNTIARYLTASDSETLVRVEQSVDLPDEIGTTDWEGRGFAVRTPNRPSTFSSGSPPFTPGHGMPGTGHGHHGGGGGGSGGGLAPPWMGGPPSDGSGCSVDLIGSLRNQVEIINGRRAVEVDCCSIFFAYYYAKTKKCYRFLDMPGST